MSMMTWPQDPGSARLQRAGDGILPSRTFLAGRRSVKESNLFLSFKKCVVAECDNQHAASVRSPESVIAVSL